MERSRSKVRELPPHPWHFVETTMPNDYDWKTQKRRDFNKHARHSMVSQFREVASVLGGGALIIFVGMTAVATVQTFVFHDNPDINSSANSTPREVPYRLTVPLNDAKPVGISAMGNVISSPRKTGCGTGHSECVPWGFIAPEDLPGIVGYAKIDDLNVVRDLTENGKMLFKGEQLCSLQLNAMIEVIGPDPKNTQATVITNYFAQNVATIDTANHTLYFSSVIYSAGSYEQILWSMKTPYKQAYWHNFNSAVNNSVMEGKGSSGGTGANANYEYDTNGTESYSSPLSIALTINVTSASDKPEILFSYLMRNGSGPVVSATFDTVKLNVPIEPGSIEPLPFITIANNSFPPPYESLEDGSLPYAQNTADLVFAGPYDGQIAVFSKTSVTQLALYGITDHPKMPYIPLNATVLPDTLENQITDETALGLALRRPIHSYAEIQSGNNNDVCASCAFVSTSEIPQLLRKE